MHSERKKGLITLTLAAILAAALITIAFTGIGNDLLSVRNIKQGLDLAGGVSITYQADVPNPTSDQMASVLSMLRRRLDSTGYSEATVATVGNNRFQVEVPGVDDVQQAIRDIGRTALITFHAPDWDGRPGEVLFDGSRITRAQWGQIQDDRRGIMHVIEFDLDAEGTRIFADATRQYIGQIIYIMMDGEILSDPRVNQAITGGSGHISGNFTRQEAQELAELIRAGSLPFSLIVMDYDSVGASLGETALRTGIISGIIGLVLIMLFMVIVYKYAGLAADLALLIYVGLMMVILSAFGITLTLPGIAGIILSIGMAVDANIVIFERLKEELADTDRSFRSAMDAAFKRAFTAIIDSNITSFIAGAVLYLLGTGPVRGFAVTLCIGIAVSMFTAIVVTRSLLKSMYAVGINNPKQYSVGSNIFGQLKLKKRTLNIVEHKKTHFIIPAVMFSLCMIFLIFNGAAGNGMFRYGVEFAGGTAMTVEMGDVNINQAREAIQLSADRLTGENVRVQSVNNGTALQITMRATDDAVLSSVRNEIRSSYPSIGNDDITTRSVSATVSGEMQRTALLAVFTALGAMFLYIAIRFRDVKIASATIIKLLVNALVLVGFYAVFRITLNNSFIIAILTVVGYSINDTIVLFDRLREIRRLTPHVDSGLMINNAVTQTITRSLYTTVSTLFAVVCLIIFGVQSIQEFAVPIMLGILFGAYTSICLAGSILHVFDKKRA